MQLRLADDRDEPQGGGRTAGRVDPAGNDGLLIRPHRRLQVSPDSGDCAVRCRDRGDAEELIGGDAPISSAVSAPMRNAFPMKPYETLSVSQP
ncbi:MAG TPA: hypothetical protein VNR65_13675 [Geobacterales bacterium]|nr:hypothetical protein [Geobacterales bacterium]